jgi:hypothetical protein
MLFYQNTEEIADKIEGNTVASVHIPDEERWHQSRELVEE